MRLRWIELRDFRNHSHTRVELPDGVITVTGPNGEGKTNLLEAMCFLLTLSSPRVSSDQPLVRRGAQAAYLRGEAQTAAGTSLIEIEIRETGANRVRVNHNPVRRKRDLRRQVRAVFFGPDDLDIVQGDPGARRRFLDECVISLWPQRETPIRAYEKTLRQRNRLLKDNVSGGAPAGLDVWDAELISTGADVTVHRREAVAAVAPGANRAFDRLAGYGLDTIYEPSVPQEGTDAVAREFRTRLDARLGDELQRRTTLVGPHRDELSLRVRDMTARAFASYGEAWAAAISLRAGQGDALADEASEPPVRLYDDPFAALDPRRRARLGEDLSQTPGQVIVSTPDADHAPSSSAVVLQVSRGVVKAT